MIKLIFAFTVVLMCFANAEDLTSDTYRNSKENRIKRQASYMAIKNQVNENIVMIKDRLKKIEGVLNFELKKENPKITTMCIPLLLVKPDNEKTTVYDERAELELEIDRLEKIEFAARIKLANANTTFMTEAKNPSAFGSKELRSKTLAEAMNFPAPPAKFSYKAFCDQFLAKTEAAKKAEAKLPKADTK